MKRLLLLTCALLLALNVGCRSGASVQNLQALAPPTTVAGTKLTQQDMRKAIINACAFRGWQTKDVSPELIEAKLVVRNKHTVVVDIPYSASGYAIKYKDSINMEYKTKSDGSMVIHPNYNKWVNTLQSDINAQLAKAGN